MYKRAALIAASGAALLLLGLPQFVLVVRGVLGRGWEGVGGADINAALLLSLFTTGLSSLVTLIFGLPLAYVLARWRFPGRRLIAAIVELPIVIPPTVAGIALLITAGRRGLLGPVLGDFGIELPFTTAAVVVAQTFVSAPFFIRTAQL